MYISSKLSPVHWAINDKSSITGVTASLDGAGTGLILTAADGRNIETSGAIVEADDKGYFGTVAAAAADEVTNGFFKGSIELESSSAAALEDGIAVKDNNSKSIVDTSSTALKVGTTPTNIDTSKVTSVSDKFVWKT